MRAISLLMLIFGFYFQDSLAARPTPDAVPSSDRAYDYALAVVLRGDRTEIVDKRIGPIRAIATCHDEASRDLVNRAVGDVNYAFGYGKIAISWSDHASIEDDAITIYVGPKRIGRQLVEHFGVSSPRTFGSATYYYWWEKERPNHIRRCLIAVDHLSTKERQLEDLRYLLLACMGFKSPWSAKQLQEKRSALDSVQEPAFTKLDTAIIRFFDKHVDPGARSWDMRRAFKNKWPDFSAAYYNPPKIEDPSHQREGGS